MCKVKWTVSPTYDEDSTIFMGEGTKLTKSINKITSTYYLLICFRDYPSRFSVTEECK